MLLFFFFLLSLLTMLWLSLLLLMLLLVVLLVLLLVLLSGSLIDPSLKSSSYMISNLVSSSQSHKETAVWGLSLVSYICIIDLFRGCGFQYGFHVFVLILFEGSSGAFGKIQGISSRRSVGCWIR
jgi:hypothetical protein